MKVKKPINISTCLAVPIAAVIIYTTNDILQPQPIPERYFVTTTNTLDGCIVLDLIKNSVTSNVTAGPCLDEYKLDKILFHSLPGTNSFVKGSTIDEEGHYSQVDKSLNFEPISTNKVSPFAIGVFEITQKQYELVTGEPHGNKFVQPDRAKDFVSWKDAHLFIDTINKKLSNYKLRLPTDTEWEYACRAGFPAIEYAFGYPDAIMTNKRIASNLSEYASYLDNADSAEAVMLDPKRFPPVGKYPQNNFGLYDMHGGVWEWCEDDWFVLKDGKVDYPKDKNGNNLKVVRGGGYWFNADDCRAANRHGYISTYRNHGFGFRCVIEPIDDIILTPPILY